MTIGAIRQATFRAVSRRFFYGWVVLGVAAVGIFASGPGQSHIFSVFLRPIANDLGISTTALTSAYAFATLAAAFGLPQVGRMIDRYGVKRVFPLICLLLGASCIVFGGANGIVWLAISFATLRLFGQGSMMLNCANLVSQWFSRRRGFALSLMALGFSVSMAVHPPVAQWLVETVGWRQAWVWLGISTWVLMLPLLILLVHNRPEDVNLRPDGDADLADDDAAGHAAARRANAGLTLKAALRTQAFYVICGGLFIISMLVTALHFFQVSIFEAQGLDVAIAARVFPVSAVTMVIAMPFVGRLLDRMPTPIMFAASLIVTAFSLAAAALVNDIPSAIVYGAVFGLNNAFSLSLWGFLWPRYFGRRHLGSIQGMGQMTGIVGASLGPIPLGIAFDLTGSYTSTLLILAILPVLWAVFALFLREPEIPDADESTVVS